MSGSSLGGGAGTRSAAGSTCGPERIQAAANIKSVSEASVAALQRRGSAEPPDRTTNRKEKNTQALRADPQLSSGTGGCCHSEEDLSGHLTSLFTF